MIGKCHLILVRWNSLIRCTKLEKGSNFKPEIRRILVPKPIQQSSVFDRNRFFKRSKQFNFEDLNRRGNKDLTFENLINNGKHRCVVRAGKFSVK